MLEFLRKQDAYIQILDAIKVGKPLPGLGLPRSARLPIVTALVKDLNIPLLLLTDRSDRALTMLDELNFWAPDISKKYFPEPNPLFYEQAAWGSVTRRERLEALTSLALYHLPGSRKPTEPVIVVTSLRAVMTRTLPRRDFLTACKTIKVGTTASPESLQRAWVDLGYEAVDTVLQHGQFSRRGGILDVWTPAEAFPGADRVFWG